MCAILLGTVSKSTAVNLKLQSRWTKKAAEMKPNMGLAYCIQQRSRLCCLCWQLCETIMPPFILTFNARVLFCALVCFRNTFRHLYGSHFCNRLEGWLKTERVVAPLCQDTLAAISYLVPKAKDSLRKCNVRFNVRLLCLFLHLYLSQSYFRVVYLRCDECTISY